MINFAIKLVAAVAMEAIQVGLQASKRMSGPRLDELKVTVAEYGTPLPRFLGARKFACPVFHAEDLKEVQTTAKTKGGKMTSYSYYATFAVAIADNPIEKVLKIWFDEKLVYDATGTGPMSLLSARAAFVTGTSLGPDLSTIMRVYLGTEDQLPDPRYAAFCEDKYGPNSAPAYRGVSYLFFEELPVADNGNRIPQVDVLAVSAAADAFPYETLPSRLEDDNIDFSPDFTRMLTCDSGGDTLDIWDTATRKIIVSRTTPVDSASNLVFGADGNIYGVTGFSNTFGMVLSSDGGALLGSSSFGHSVAGVIWAGGVACYTPLGAQTRAFWYSGVATALDISFVPNFYFTGPNGNPWAVGVSGTDIKFLDIFTGTAMTATIGSSNTAVYALTNPAGKIFCRQGNSLFILDPATVTVGATGTSTASGPFDAFANYPGGNTLWMRNNEFSTLDCSLVQTIPYSSWYTGALSKCFDPINNALVGSHSSIIQTIDWLYVGRAASDGTTLGAIVDKMCDAADLTDRDTSVLTQHVDGYSWTRGDVKSQMEPLLDIHDVDSRPHDFTLQFLPRGSAATGTILTQDFAKSGDGPRYKQTFAQDSDLPRIVRVNFVDIGMDQQTNNVLSPLPSDSVDTQRDVTIDMTTYADSAAGAQQKSDRYVRRQWNSRETIENALTAQYLALEPGDVQALSLDGIVHNARLIKQTIAGGRIDCTFVRDEVTVAAINSATTGPGLDVRTPEVITIPPPVAGFVVDAPLASDNDADVRPLLYAGAGTYAGLTFSGTIIYEATGTGTSRAYDLLFKAVSSGATWGACHSTLGNANANLWDRGNTLTVTLEEGSLTSVAEADIDADPSLNLLLVGSPRTGWEYVNFTTATLNGDGTYTLSHFKRGRRGTEGMCGSHSAGEVWLLASSTSAVEMGLDDLASSLSFKAQSVGRSLDAAPAIDVAPYTAATLKPYAPASIAWTWDGTNLTGTITRRTRLGGAWVGGATIPLSENSEAYEVDVYNGVTFKRTISVSSTNVFTYTAAMAAADGITLPTPPSVKVYQMSDAVGRGFALAA